MDQWKVAKALDAVFRLMLVALLVFAYLTTARGDSLGEDMTDKQVTSPQIVYNEEGLAAAHRVATHLFKAMKHIDFLALKAGLQERMKPANDHEKAQLQRYFALLDNAHVFRETFKETGIPRTQDEMDRKKSETPAKQSSG